MSGAIIMAESFEARMRKRGEQAVKNINEAVRACALAVDQQVVTASPVDTGRFRSNWLASLEVPVAITTQPYSPGEGGSTGGANSAAAMAQANSVIASRQPGQDIWISNNLPYAQRLNDGYSRQAPANFVEQGIRNGIAELRRAKIFD